MSSTDVSASTDGTPTYVGGGDPAGTFTDYYPAWLDTLAADVTVEGSMLDGAVQGPEAVRTIVVTIRTLYGDSQEVPLRRPLRRKRLARGLHRAGRRQAPRLCRPDHPQPRRADPAHRGASYRPRSSLLLFSRLLGEKFAGTPYAKYFLASES